MTTSTYSFERVNGPFTLNTTTTDDQTDPSVVTFADGSGIVFFDAGNKIAARTFDVNGNPTGTQFDVSAGTGATEPEATLLSNGNIVVTWQDGTGATKTLARVYSPSLGTIKDIFPVETGGGDPYHQPDVAATSDGGFVVVSDVAITGTDSDIAIDMFNASGNLIHTAAFTANNTIDQDASVAVLANGNVAVAWERQVGSGANLTTQVWRAVYSPDLLTMVAAPQAFDASGAVNKNVDVVARPDGSFIVSYEENSSGTTDILSREFSATGAIGDFWKSGATSAPDVSANAATSSDGYVLVADVNQATAVAWSVDGAIITPDGKLVTVNDILQGGKGFNVSPSVTWVDGNTVQLAYSASVIADGNDGAGYGIDVARFHVVHTTTGDASDENIQGDGLIDVINGLGGVDTLNGGDGDDRLYGGKNHDTLKGGSGADSLYGGRGNDQMSGGDGADVFYFAKGDTGRTQANADTIFDFTFDDKIDLSAIDAKVHVGGDQKFKFIHSHDFHHKAGELRFDEEKSDTWIYGDTDGNGKADFVIHLDDPLALTKHSFAL